eukprot:GHRQ01010590.1.p1 GENE.GHRQ01010590.1~~GHRQ01010590.1.p1  ORF type:complete len:218 (-),score=15.10 GHRQ01010590.1:334-987(-)
MADGITHPSPSRDQNPDPPDSRPTSQPTQLTSLTKWPAKSLVLHAHDIQQLRRLHAPNAEQDPASDCNKASLCCEHTSVQGVPTASEPKPGRVVSRAQQLRTCCQAPIMHAYTQTTKQARQSSCCWHACAIIHAGHCACLSSCSRPPQSVTSTVLLPVQGVLSTCCCTVRKLVHQPPLLHCSSFDICTRKLTPCQSTAAPPHNRTDAAEQPHATLAL